MQKNRELLNHWAYILPTRLICTNKIIFIFANIVFTMVVFRTISIASFKASPVGREMNLIGLGRVTWKGDASPDFMERVTSDRP